VDLRQPGDPAGEAERPAAPEPSQDGPINLGLATLLFTDIEGGVRLWEADRDAMAAASARHDGIVREQVEAWGGQVFKTVSESHRAVFADPVSALSSAVAIQRAVGAEAWPSGLPIRVCMAMHSGACSERDGDYVGPVVNRAARLLDIGHGGQILMTAAAYALLADRLPGGIAFRDLGEQRLRDLGRAERVFQVTGPGLAEGFGVLRSLDDPALRHNLPSQATSFVGRAVELAELRALVSGGSRLVTIAGPGGIGKSRLALQVAADFLDGTGDGVWLVELAPVAEPELVARTVAAALGVREAPGQPMLDTLVEAIDDRDLLLILDNAEHVLDAVTSLADAIIASCPRACVLVTSREPLGTSGEHVFRVPGLAVPPADLAAPDQLAAFESVQLFAEHAALHRRGFVVDDANAAAVASICVRLDGIPLALELAAARLGSLSASEVDARLDHRFRLLTTGNRTARPRHQTLRALIDWSYDLLSSQERIVFDLLSVFAGGWTLEAAEAVVADGDIAEWQVLDLVAALVGKSLVQAEVIGGSTRYRLLETSRHYAAERLALRAASGLGAARVAHRDHYLALVETASAHLRGPDEAAWLDRLEAEFDNIRAALAFSIADPDSAEPGLRLATGLKWFCYMRGHSVEVIEAFSALLRRPDARQPTRHLARALTANCHLLNNFSRSPDTPSMAAAAITIARGLGDDLLTCDALCALSWFRLLDGDLPAALAAVDEAVTLGRAAGDPRLLTTALSDRAAFRGEAGDLAAALADHQEVLALARANGDNYVLGTTLLNLGVDQVGARENQAGVAYLREALAVAEAHGYQHLAAGVATSLGFAHLIDGDVASARRPLISVLDTARATGTNTHVHVAILGLALAVGPDGDPAVAATLHGAAERQYERAGQAFDADDLRLRAGDHARLLDALGEIAFEAAREHGRALTQADAMALAVTAAQPEPEHDPGPASTVAVHAARRASAGSPADPLSAREREIMALLAGGASNAKIAERLFLTTNTVRTHLDRIRDKTGARNRAELTRYAIAAGIEPVVPSP
jgi:predicted ATPase/class 3 adenylate cyclase/DNA-binding CsgD family transcriptional regulator